MGCGPSFLKQFHENTIYTDIELHDNCDLIVDAQKMPFENNSIVSFGILSFPSMEISSTISEVAWIVRNRKFNIR